MGSRKGETPEAARCGAREPDPASRREAGGHPMVWRTSMIAVQPGCVLPDAPKGHRPTRKLSMTTTSPCCSRSLFSLGAAIVGLSLSGLRESSCESFGQQTDMCADPDADPGEEDEE